MGLDPVTPLKTLVPGTQKLAWSRRLKTSARSCTFIRSLGLKSLAREASTSSSPGPVRVFLPRLPYVPGAGTEKAQGSYHRPGGGPSGNPAGILLPFNVQPAVTPDVGLLLKPGFKLGRSGNHRTPFAATLPFPRAVNGSPER